MPIKTKPTGCRFVLAWHGYCDKETIDGEFCKDHKGVKCQLCKEQGTQECSDYGSFGMI